MGARCSWGEDEGYLTYIRTRAYHGPSNTHPHASTHTYVPSNRLICTLWPGIWNAECERKQR